MVDTSQVVLNDYGKVFYVIVFLTTISKAKKDFIK